MSKKELEFDNVCLLDLLSSLSASFSTKITLEKNYFNVQIMKLQRKLHAIISKLPSLAVWTYYIQYYK